MATYPIPANLPQTAAQTTQDQPWPLRLLSKKISEYIDKMSTIWVEGEVISLQRRPGAKVQFLTLRDVDAEISMNVKIFTHLLPQTVNKGNRIVVRAKPDFYEVNGSLSLWANEIHHVGTGDILARLEQLKNLLAAEGLFSPQRKKALPFLPRTIGLICGRNTKAMEDVVVNSKLRWPAVTFDIREVQVQGAGAVDAMLEALAALDTEPHVDVIVLARGGGSVEDLLPFSDEQLVRAAAAAKTPIVSAIGHEGDNPILDLVADLRASTPTDAAKRIVPDVAEEFARITEARRRTLTAIDTAIDREQSQLDALLARPVMASPETMIEAREDDITALVRWLRAHTGTALVAGTADISQLTSRLRALSPHATLERGYAILLNDSHTVTDAADVVPDSPLTAILARGRLNLSVRSTHV